LRSFFFNTAFGLSAEDREIDEFDVEEEDDDDDDDDEKDKEEGGVNKEVSVVVFC